MMKEQQHSDNTQAYTAEVTLKYAIIGFIIIFLYLNEINEHLYQGKNSTALIRQY